METSGESFDGSSASDVERGWRAGHRGRDAIFYEEFHEGAWQRIEVQGEMLMGRAHHVIYFASPEEWLRYPAWAKDRRNEIVARIMSAFREPDYEYHGVAAASPAVSSVAAAMANRETIPARTHAKATHAPVEDRRALVLAIVLVLAISVGMAGLVVYGLTSGETFWPSKRPSQRRSVSLAAEPGMYWTSLLVYSVLGLGTLGLGVWGIREGRKLR